MKSHFTRYEKAVSAAQRELGIALIPEIQSRLAIAHVNGDGEFYVCTGMGACQLSSERFHVIYKDEEELGPQVDTDDFDLGEKLKKDGKYCVYVHCKPSTRSALLEVNFICEELINRDLQHLLPYKVFRDRIER